jgi:hypothetical protein
MDLQPRRPSTGDIEQMGSNANQLKMWIWGRLDSFF